MRSNCKKDERRPPRAGGALKGALYVLPVLMLLTSGPLAAEVVFLRDNTILFGTVLSQTTTTVRLRTDKGRVTLAKAKIRRISYDAAEERRLKGEQIAQERRRAEEGKEKDLRRAEAARRQSEAEARRPSGATSRKGTKAMDPGPLPRIWRSAVLPGWGFFYVDRPLLGAAYGVLTVTGFATAGAAASQARRARGNHYQTTQLTLLPAFLSPAPELPARFALKYVTDAGSNAAYRSSVSRANLALGVAGLIYLGQIAHAWLASDTQSVAAGPGTPAASWGLDFVRPTVVEARSGTSFRLAPEWSFRYSTPVDLR